MGRELLAPLGDDGAARGEVDVGGDGAALQQHGLDAGLEVLGHHGAVLREDLEDVVAEEAGVGLGVDEEHVDDAGGEELDGVPVDGDDEVLEEGLVRKKGRKEGQARWRGRGADSVPWSMRCRTSSSGS